MTSLAQERKLYTADYFEAEYISSKTAAAIMVPMMLEMFAVSSVLDVGCGRGAFLETFAECGITDLIGIDGDYVPAFALSREHFRVHDLKFPFHLHRHFDLAICVEVAEHLPERCAWELVNCIVEHADVVLFSAAVVDQFGVGHINEQPHSYWQDKFAQRGYNCLDMLRPKLQNAAIDPWYSNNSFIFANVHGLFNNPSLKQ